MAKILITGGTGFLGSHLLRKLSSLSPHEIIAIHRKGSSFQLVSDIKDKITWHCCDILDFEGLKKVMIDADQIYHTAATVSYHPKLKQTMELVNIKGTANIVDAALQCRNPRLLHVSSIAAIGRVQNESLVSEKNPWNPALPTSHYGITKHHAETEVNRGIAQGLNAVMINPSVIIGEGDWKNSTSRFFPRAYKGQRFYPQGGTGFVDVLDVVDISIAMMESELRGERVIANGDNIKFKKFFDLLAEAMDVSGPSIAVGDFLAELAWRVEGLRCKLTGSTPFLTKETARTSMRTHQFDNTKSRELFNFTYRPLEKTIGRTARAYLKSIG